MARQWRATRLGLHERMDEQGWANDVDMAKLSPREVQLVQAAVEATPDACPPPRLQTVIAGSLL